MRFHIVTPCHNAAPYIGETIQSILSQTVIQNGQASLHYVIMDGASTDNTVAVARAALQSAPPSATVEIHSEPDNGMYDAIWKGMSSAEADVCAYLNAGDLYTPKAFEVVMTILKDPTVHWLTGMQMTYNQHGHLVAAALPFRYRRHFFEAGLYNRVRPTFIQQESTFWRASLNTHIDPVKFTGLRAAGDVYLWTTFAAAHTNLTIVGAHLGGFRVHPGQKSENMKHYQNEIDTFTRPPTIFERLQHTIDRMLWYAPQTIKKRFNPHHLRLYNHKQDRWL